MKIVKVICSKGRTGFFFDDQKAIKAGAVANGNAYEGKPLTDGFTAVRQPGEAISVQLILENGQIALGDCAAVQYSGAGGRDPLFLAENFIPVINEHIAPVFEGVEADNFVALCHKLEAIEVDGKRLHTAIRYGFSQALLDAVAKANNMLMCEVVAKEYNLEVSKEMIDIFSQSGDDRYNNADKMIIKGSPILPHALINNVETKLGVDGGLLKEYVTWLKNRVIELRVDENYSPIFHIDVYGTIGMAFGNENYEAMANYIGELEKAAHPFKLRIEGPMDADGRQAQMEHMRDLRQLIDEKGIQVELVADEWCNTLDDIKFFADNKAGHMAQIKTPDLGSIHNSVEAVLYCQEKGFGAYQGGTCNETDRSAQVCTQIAMATKPQQILAKPGMGVDEGFMIVYNEMQRVLAYIEAVR